MFFAFSPFALVEGLQFGIVLRGAKGGLEEGGPEHFGTVTKVETLQSTGAALADSEVKNTFKKWRFRPNSVSEVRVPAYYNRG